ncbi:MAG: DUF3365 domain-containing protein [Nitrospirae bacterium]|nr:MAG: DUF3365 domain-containing protein [Nitrospirota bacterium]
MALGRIKSWLFSPENPFKLSLMLSLPLIAVLLILFYSVIHWNKKSIEDIQERNMLLYAQSLFQHIIQSPLWRGDHSGYFIEITEHITGSSPRRLNIMGKDYVRVAPSIYTARIGKLVKKRAAYSFHITSLESLNQANRPDSWEIQALNDFKYHIKKDALTRVVFGNVPYYRYMAPIKLEGACLSCHAPITAGLSIDIPIDFSDRLYASQLKRSALSFATFGVFILLFVMAITIYFSKRISDSFRAIKKLNSRLEELSAKNKRMLESIVDAIAVIGTNNVVELINPGFTNLLGVKPEEVVGKTIDEIKNSELKELLLSPSGKEVIVRERVLKVSDVDVFDQEGILKYGVIKIIHDATEEKLAAAMELAGATAHEVRQPLTIILNLIPLIRDKIANSEDATSEFSMLEEQCGRINDIINRMLNITRYRRRPYTDELSIFDLTDE